MFKLTLGNTVYEVTFYYSRPNGKNEVVDKKLKNGATLCQVSLENPDGTTVYYHGYSICSLEDNFNKVRGRKLALTNCLLSVPDKEVRTSLWNEYFNHTKKG